MKGVSGNNVTKVENDRVTILEHYAKNPHSAQRGSLSATPFMIIFLLSHRKGALGKMQKNYKLTKLLF